MTRWEPDAATRLEQAALELFAEQGFAATTIPQITERAGLTTRSFFRHYVDKREVLFRGDNEIPDTIAALMARAPRTLSLIDLILWGAETMASIAFEGRRETILARRAIIATDPGLRERELGKQASLATAITEALTRSGIDPVAADLAGKITITISSTAIEAWLADDQRRPLIDHVTAVRENLTRVITDEVPWAQSDWRRRE